MPLAPPRLCPTCRTPVPAGARCPQCRRRGWAADDRRRGGAQGRGYSYAWQELVARQLRRTPWCAVCGATDDLTGDHVVPLSRGGRAVPGNVRILCRTHNSARGAPRG
jgi:5-methylcytosine-specific restriction protein A